MKKKTLIYLDGDLVEREKKDNLDILKLTEEVLKVIIPRQPAIIFK